LKAKAAKLNRENKAYFAEMAERGKTIEPFRRLSYDWKNQMPEGFANEAMAILNPYIERCTV
jgi:hypothetical protein